MPPSHRGRTSRLNSTILPSTRLFSPSNSEILSPGADSDLDTASNDTSPIRRTTVTCSPSSPTNTYTYFHPLLITDENSIDSISIYRHPLTIFSYFGSFMVRSTHAVVHALMVTYFYYVLSLAGIFLAFIIASHIDGFHQPFLLVIQSFIRWYGTWIILGILSSVGLGSGLHTFLLFLGPHIAQVTSAAYSCGHTDFMSLTWDQITCTPLSESALLTVPRLTLFSVARKVQWDAFCWGIGTAIGELPPYFVASAAAQSGKRNEELSDLDELLNKRAADMSWSEWAKVQVMFAMKRFGFWGILACASIPNPLFDLAGIICGTVGIPFRTFFGATVIGKAIIKTSIQSVFVAVLFSHGGRSTLLQILDTWAPPLHAPISKFLHEQTAKYMRTNVDEGMVSTHAGTSAGKIISQAWNVVIAIMLGYFIFSIIESLAKQEMERLVIKCKGKEDQHDPSLSTILSKRTRSRSRSHGPSSSTSLIPSSASSTTSNGLQMNGINISSDCTSNGITRLRRTSDRSRTKPVTLTPVTPVVDLTGVRDSDADAEMSSPAPYRRRSTRTRSKHST